MLTTLAYFLILRKHIKTSSKCFSSLISRLLSCSEWYANITCYESLTKKECLLSAYDIFIEDEQNERNGQAVETAFDSHYFHEIPEYKNDVIKRTDKVYEPWFQMMHSDQSGLENTYKEPLRRFAKS